MLCSACGPPTVQSPRKYPFHPLAPHVSTPLASLDKQTQRASPQLQTQHLSFSLRSMQNVRLRKTRPWDGSPIRYPDPAIEILDERFQKYAIGNAAVERLCTGLRWGEGALFGLGMRVACSSAIFPTIASCAGAKAMVVSMFFDLRPITAMGTPRDRAGRLVSCEHGHAPRDPHRIRRVYHRSHRPF